MMTGLYLEGQSSDDGNLCLPAESVSILFVLKYCKNKYYDITFVNYPKSSSSSLSSSSSSSVVQIPTEKIATEFNISLSSFKEIPNDIQQCCLPAVKIRERNRVLSGLGCVARNIIITASQQAECSALKKLLGHKAVCLKACAEVSSWTKFCEVEYPSMVNNDMRLQNRKLSVPTEALKLENQFKQPVVVANINKRRQLMKKKKVDADPENQCAGTLSQASGDLRHDFVEGPDMTLSDLVLLPLFISLLNQWTDYIHHLQSSIPLTLHWYELMVQQPSISTALALCGLPIVPLPSPIHVQTKDLTSDVNCLASQAANLHIREAKQKKFKASLADISKAMEKLEGVLLDGLIVTHPCQNIKLPWKQLPEAVHPKDGELPLKRLERKCEQLENLAQAVIAVARPGNIVVDFCSGGGHLGILLAYLLPECSIILVENKEESIHRAEQRIEKIALKNVTIYQCNLDYFKGRFDIGTCLHACGVATDLVLQCCLDNQASFVICPCCYGSINNTHTVTYPRSHLIQESGLSYQEYLCLGHGGDQTQFNIAVAKQGKQCMTLIDRDRAALAQEHGYEVTLTTLQPAECSPKNNLLIGTKICSTEKASTHKKQN